MNTKWTNTKEKMDFKTIKKEIIRTKKKEKKTAKHNFPSFNNYNLKISNFIALLFNNTLIYGNVHS
jgi:hypothetical protein